MIYSAKWKQTVVQMHLNGMSFRQIERETGCDRKEVAEWVRRYRNDGLIGLKRKPKARTTYELRRKIVKEYLESDADYAMLCNRYSVSRITLKGWVTSVRKYGYESLIDSKIGRPPKKAQSPGQSV